MPHTAYPTGTEIGAYISSLGLLAGTDLTAFLAALDLTSMADAAAAAWERDTGWTPFLKDTVAVSRRFDAPGPNRRGLTRGGGNRLDFEAGLLELTAIVSGYANDDAGDAAVLEDDYYLWPPNAPVEGRPWTMMDLNFAGWGRPQSLRITGYWGYAATIPADAWQAILRQAAMLAYTQLTAAMSGGVKSWSEADIKEEYDFGFLGLSAASGSGSGRAAPWESQWQQAVNRYRRPYL